VRPGVYRWSGAAEQIRRRGPQHTRRLWLLQVGGCAKGDVERNAGVEGLPDDCPYGTTLDPADRVEDERIESLVEHDAGLKSSRESGPRESQSTPFFIAPVIDQLGSGEVKTMPSAASTPARSERTESGMPAALSSSWL
jgi:hypothetical protein